MVGLWYRWKLRGTREASNGGMVRVRIIHGLNISHKNSYTYCKNLEVIKNQALCACSQRDRLVGKDHCSSPTATHKDAQSKYTSWFKFGFGCTGEVCTNSQGEKGQCTVPKRQWWKGKSAYNPWTQHQSKELIYLLKKFRSHQKSSTTRMLLGGQIGRKRPSLVPDRHS